MGGWIFWKAQRNGCQEEILFPQFHLKVILSLSQAFVHFHFCKTLLQRRFLFACCFHICIRCVYLSFNYVLNSCHTLLISKAGVPIVNVRVLGDTHMAEQLRSTLLQVTSWAEWSREQGGMQEGLLNGYTRTQGMCLFTWSVLWLLGATQTLLCSIVASSAIKSGGFISIHT